MALVWQLRLVHPLLYTAVGVAVCVTVALAIDSVGIPKSRINAAAKN